MPRNKLENIGIPSLDDDVFLSDKKREEDSAENMNIPIEDIIDSLITHLKSKKMMKC